MTNSRVPNDLELRRIFFGLERGVIHFAESFDAAKVWSPHRLVKKCCFTVFNKAFHHLMPPLSHEQLLPDFLEALNESRLLHTHDDVVAMSISRQRLRIRLIISGLTSGARFVKFRSLAGLEDGTNLPRVLPSGDPQRVKNDTVCAGVIEQFEVGDFAVEVLEFVPKRLPVLSVRRKQLLSLHDRMFSERIVHNDLMPWNIGVRGCGNFVLFDREDIWQADSTDGLREILERDFRELFACLPWITRLRLRDPSHWNLASQYEDSP